MSYSDLENYYKTTYALTQVHNVALNDVLGMLPYERDLFVDMLAARIRDAQTKSKQKQGM